MQNALSLDGDLVAAIVYCRHRHMLSTGSWFLLDEFDIGEFGS